MPKISIPQFQRLLRILRSEGGFAAFRRWKPFSITAFEMMQSLRSQGFSFRTIIDAGANVGQFARAAAETWPEARIFSYEALPEVAAAFADNLHDLASRVHIEQVALGSQEGVISFHRTPYSLQSSALKPLHLASEPVEVAMRCLDEALQDLPIHSPALLKLDLQGYELEALQGAEDLLRRVDYVLLETAFRPSYEGEPSFNEVHAFLIKRGFVFLRPLDFLREGDEIHQMDALFARLHA